MTSENKVRITLRIPKDIHDAIKKQAYDLGISVNACISLLLAKELSDKKGK